jgi:hypothetical protein
MYKSADDKIYKTCNELDEMFRTCVVKEIPFGDEILIIECTN